MDLEFSILKNRLQERMAADNITDADVQGWTLADMTKVCMCYARTTSPCASSGTCLPGLPGKQALKALYCDRMPALLQHQPCLGYCSTCCCISRSTAGMCIRKCQQHNRHI